MEKEKLEIYNKLRNISKDNGKKPIFISYSKLQKYLYCPLSYRIQYIDKEKVEFEKNINGEIGTLSHDIIEKECKGELKFKDNNDRAMYFREKANNLALEFGLEKDIPLIQSLYDFFKMSDYKDKYINAEFEVPVYYKLKYINDEYDYWVVGFIDCVLHNEDGTVNIIDFKTSNTSGYTGVKLQQALLQIGSYAYIYEHMFRKRVNKIGYHFLKYGDIKFIDYKGKNRKTSKVERRKIIEEFNNKNGISDLIISDCYSMLEFNKENRLEYMKKLIELFKEIDNTNYSDFTSKNRDVGYCERFCPFRNSEKCKIENQYNYTDIFKNNTMMEICKIALKNDNINVDIVW